MRRLPDRRPEMRGPEGADRAAAGSGCRVVLDTNVVLDLLVFDDPATTALKSALTLQVVDWVATPAMREELHRVLDYPRIASRLRATGRATADVLARFDHQADLVPAARRSQLRCSDPDDQIFVDLAMAHQAWLLSKDDAVRRLGKRLGAAGVRLTAPGAENWRSWLAVRMSGESTAGG